MTEVVPREMAEEEVEDGEEERRTLGGGGGGMGGQWRMGRRVVRRRGRDAKRMDELEGGRLEGGTSRAGPGGGGGERGTALLWVIMLGGVMGCQLEGGIPLAGERGKLGSGVEQFSRVGGVGVEGRLVCSLMVSMLLLREVSSSSSGTLRGKRSMAHSTPSGSQYSAQAHRNCPQGETSNPPSLYNLARWMKIFALRSTGSSTSSP